MLILESPDFCSPSFVRPKFFNILFFWCPDFVEPSGFGSVAPRSLGRSPGVGDGGLYFGWGVFLLGVLFSKTWGSGGFFFSKPGGGGLFSKKC